MAWNRDNPATSAALASAAVRSNFQALDQSLAGENLIRDPYFIIWPAGDSAAPAHWKTSGSPTVSRTTSTSKAKSMCAGLTGSSTGKLIQSVLNSTDFPALFQGVPMSWGCWVWSDTASVAKIGVDDGVTPTYSDTHTGGSSWEWLTGTITLDAAATQILFDCSSLSATAITRFDLPTLVFGEVPPQAFIPPRVQKGFYNFASRGDAVVEARRFEIRAGRPYLVTNVALWVKVAPTGAAIIVDVNHYDGSVFQSMFSSPPQIAASTGTGGKAPDGTYRYRCFQGAADTDIQTDTLMDIDIDQVGSSVTGANLTTRIDVLQFLDSLETFRSPDSHGNE